MKKLLLSVLILLTLCSCYEDREIEGYCDQCGKEFYSRFETSTVFYDNSRYCTSCVEEFLLYQGGDSGPTFNCDECGEDCPASLLVQLPEYEPICIHCAYDMGMDVFATDDDRPAFTCVNCGTVTGIEFELSGGVGGSYAYVCFDCYESLPHCEECGCATPKDLLLTIGNDIPICIYCAQACGFSIIVTE